jgi:membrane fusion protein
MGDTSEQISSQLLQEQVRLKASIEETKKLSNEQAVDLQMQQRMARQQISELEGQITIQQNEVKDLSALLKRFEQIGGDTGVISPLQIQQQRTQEMDAEQQIKALTRQKDQALQQLLTATDQLAQLPLNTSAKVTDIQHQLAQNDQALAQNEVDRDVVMSASESGTVAAVLVKPGDAIASGQTLITVVPKGSLLEAQLLVPSEAIGFIHNGSQVVLHYQPFPYQKFGIQKGSVIGISQSALTPSQVTTLVGGEPPKESQYLVDVQIKSQSIYAYGRSEPLKPGMVIDADLLLDKRRMIEWIFEPIYGMARRWEGEE